MKPIVMVTWHDAETSDGWADDTDLALVPAVTVGFLITENEHSILLAATIGKDVMTNNRVKIPRMMVQNMIELVPAPVKRVKKI